MPFSYLFVKFIFLVYSYKKVNKYEFLKLYFFNTTFEYKHTVLHRKSALYRMSEHPTRMSTPLHVKIFKCAPHGMNAIPKIIYFPISRKIHYFEFLDSNIIIYHVWGPMLALLVIFAGAKI